MDNFTNDLQLLMELQGLIDEGERNATMDKTTTEIVGSISPIVKALMPLAKKKEEYRVDVLIRVRDRLKELM